MPLTEENHPNVTILKLLEISDELVGSGLKVGLQLIQN
jgi:hypothetical protein